MRELSLFTGAGGGLLGTKLLGWRTIGYVEIDPYCQQIIAQRIKDGILDEAPIFSDIRSFTSDGYAEHYSGLVDVITAGFPCQPFSVAGNHAGPDDPRNMWPATLETIRTVRPRYCLLENVPGLVTSGYFGTILGGLAECGYDCCWRILSAAEVGAPHKRDRLWIVAHAKGINRNGLQVNISGKVFRKAQWGKELGRPIGSQFIIHEGEPEWTIHESAMGGMADGMAYRVDRLKAIGNGQVPRVETDAWSLLTEDLPYLWQCE